MPALQLWQAVQPFSLYVPARHELHVLWPVSPCFFPTTHWVQTNAPAAEYVPVQHVRQAAELDTPVELWYFPAVQPMQVPVPAFVL